MSTTTASIRCSNGGTPHTHHSVEESKICYGLMSPPALAPVVRQSTGASVLSAPSSPAAPITERQLWYIEKHWGKPCAMAAKYLTKKQGIELIDQLKNPQEKPMTHPVVTPDPTPPPVQSVTDARVPMLAGLIGAVPDGLYAVQEYDGGHVDFLRISRPKTGKYGGSIKVQTQHGSYGDGKYKTRAVLWPSGRFSVWHPPVIDMLMLLVTDHISAALLYAKKSNRCCRCNAKLTDDRSRKYGIGPECEKSWPHIIEAVDEREAMEAS